MQIFQLAKMGTEECSIPRIDVCRNFNLDHLSKGSLIFAEGAGRFGNQFQVFLLLLGVRLILESLGRNGLEYYMSRSAMKYLSAVFSKDSLAKSKIRILEDEFCGKSNYGQFMFQPYDGDLSDFIDAKDLHQGKMIHLFPAHEKGKESGFRPKEHEGGKWGFKHEILSQVWVQENLQFHPELDKRANRKLNQIARSVGIQDLVHVGVHVRRTDVGEYRRYRKPLPRSYFLEAMEVFRNDHDNVVFLVASDDMAWCEKAFKGIHDVFLVGNGETDKDQDDLAVISGKETSWALDLAILSKCNHSVSSMGTFSNAAAILAGGEFYTHDQGLRVPIYYLENLGTVQYTML